MAVAAVSLDLSTGAGEYVGVGNVETRWLNSRQKLALLPVPGIVGRHGQKIRKHLFNLEAPGTLLLASDGISLRNLEADLRASPGPDPVSLARKLFLEQNRKQDDHTVLVARFRHGSSSRSGPVGT
jgi:hypothetical protein